MLNRIIETIEEFDIICLFRHEYPDMDAIGSQLGLKQVLMEKYPHKEIYACGSQTPLAGKFGESMDDVDDEIVRMSLAIVLDTSNAGRVDDQRFRYAKKSIRIDHHVLVEKYCDIEYVDDKASAACELIALGLDALEWPISSHAAQMLYSGLVADSIRFTISSVRKETMFAAAYLIEQGVDVIQCDEDNFSSTYEDYQYETKVREKSQRYGNCLIAIMEQEDYLPMHFANAKEKVYVLSGIEGITCWALFTKMEDGKTYSASLRSKRMDVRDIAVEYGGGGHKCACGIKHLSLPQVQEIIEKLKKRSQE